ncbi:MAG TPA: universal stress protein [Microlunatus sp.]|nr:universal stress protein [Microlunatus sp.]
MSKHLIVGIDGSPESEAAMAWALEEARRRELEVELIYALAVPVVSDAYGMVMTRPDIDELTDYSQNLLDAALISARSAAPDVTVSARLASGPPSAVLIEASKHADGLVVGTRGLGAISGKLLGSVSVRLAGKSFCPVFIVPPEWRERPAPDGTVLVGVDGSEHSDAALRFALEEARCRGIGLSVLCAYHVPWLARPVEPQLIAEFEESERWLADQTITESLDRTRGHAYTDVPIERITVKAMPGEALVEAARSAVLTVVGSRGRRSFPRAILGSVSRTLMQEAERPIAVVHKSTKKHGRDL